MHCAESHALCYSPRALVILFKVVCDNIILLYDCYILSKPVFLSFRIAFLILHLKDIPCSKTICISLAFNQLILHLQCISLKIRLMYFRQHFQNISLMFKSTYFHVMVQKCVSPCIFLLFELHDFVQTLKSAL